MSRQSQSQQMIGFAVGNNATAPTHIIPARQYSHSVTQLFDNLKATLGSRDNHYKQTLVGFESLPISLTVPLDDKICPILIGAGMQADTTGTSPNFINTLTPFNLKAGNPSIDGNRLTFFFYDAENGLIKQSGKLSSTAQITPEQDQLNLEVEFLGGVQEVLTGAAKTTAEAGFTISSSTIGYLFKPGDVRVAFADTIGALDYTNALSVDFGFNIEINNNTQEEMKTLSGAGTLISPTSYYGQFQPSFEFTHDVADNVLFDRYVNNTETAFGFRIQKDSNVSFEFQFEAISFDLQQQDKVADSDEPVKQTITVEHGRNSITNPSLTVISKCATNLQTLFA